MPAKKPAQKPATKKSASTIETASLNPELAQFLQQFLTSSVIADKLRAVESNSQTSKNKLAATMKKVDAYEKTASKNELALFDFVTNYGLSEMYNKSLMALVLNFTMDGIERTDEIAQQVQTLLQPITLPENRMKAAYVFKEWLIDHAQESVKKLTNSKKPARGKKASS